MEIISGDTTFLGLIESFLVGGAVVAVEPGNKFYYFLLLELFLWLLFLVVIEAPRFKLLMPLVLTAMVIFLLTVIFFTGDA